MSNVRQFDRTSQDLEVEPTLCNLASDPGFTGPMTPLRNQAMFDFEFERLCPGCERPARFRGRNGKSDVYVCEAGDCPVGEFNVLNPVSARGQRGRRLSRDMKFCREIATRSFATGLGQEYTHGPVAHLESSLENARCLTPSPCHCAKPSGGATRMARMAPPLPRPLAWRRAPSGICSTASVVVVRMPCTRPTTRVERRHPSPPNPWCKPPWACGGNIRPGEPD